MLFVGWHVSKWSKYVSARQKLLTLLVVILWMMVHGQDPRRSCQCPSVTWSCPSATRLPRSSWICSPSPCLPCETLPTRRCTASTSPSSTPFRRKVGAHHRWFYIDVFDTEETSEKQGGAPMGFSEHVDTILNWTAVWSSSGGASVL